MPWPEGALLALAAFAAMEGVAWASHRWVMHGFLWRWHESHHRPGGGLFEKNDLFALLFALPSMALMGWGFPGLDWPFWTGLGMAAYGAAYFAFHDALAHGRFGLRWVPRSRYARAVLASHRLHHARRDKEGCVSFGFLLPLSAERRRRERREDSVLP